MMQVLYLANKYIVPSLVPTCCILSYAQKFGDKDLEDRCWVVIERQTEEACMNLFVTVERSVAESVVKRERLYVKEVKLFKGVDRWATKESERQGITLECDGKRRILGEETVKEIRFPLMSQKKFAIVVFDSCILSCQEVGEMVKHCNYVLSTPLPNKQTPRKATAPIRRCSRFKKFRRPKTGGGWGGLR